MQGLEPDLHSKFQPNRTKIAKVIPFLVGRLVEPVCIHQFLKENLTLKRIIKICFHTKNQPNSSKRSQVRAIFHKSL